MAGARASIVDRWRALRRDVKEHKSAIRRHREQLWAASAALKKLEAECRAMGIALYPSTGEEGDTLHGHGE